MPELPSVSVVVPTYNGVTLLERILRPLSEDPATTEVIVVIDGSRDGSKELVDRLAREDPRLRSVLIENSGDMGARDVGARAATGEIVLFVDDDVLADPGLVSGHARRHAEAGADIVLGYMPVVASARRGPLDFPLMFYAASTRDVARCTTGTRQRGSTSVGRELLDASGRLPGHRHVEPRVHRALPRRPRLRAQVSRSRPPRSVRPQPVRGASARSYARELRP